MRNVANFDDSYISHMYYVRMIDPQNIVLELLRAIRADLAEVKKAVANLKDGQISIGDHRRVFMKEHAKRKFNRAAQAERRVKS